MTENASSNEETTERSETAEKSELKTNQDEENAKRMARKKKYKNQIDSKIFSSSLDPHDKPLTWWTKQPVKYACNYSPVKKKLEILMGSNVVRLTDRNYMQELAYRMRENHKNQQCKRIEERKIRELSRTKKMVLHKLLPIQEAPEEIRQYPLFQLFTYCEDLLERRRKKKTKQKVRISKSLYQLLYPKDDKDRDKEEEEEIYMKKIREGNEEKMVPLSPEEIAKYLHDKEISQDIEAGFMLSNQDYDHLHYETQAVKNLRKTKTVDELYSKAYDIIGILHSHVDKQVLEKETDADKTNGNEND